MQADDGGRRDPPDWDGLAPTAAPTTSTSPASHGLKRIGGYRIFEASAVHPFSVGFDHSRTPAAVTQVDVWVRRAGRRLDRPARNRITTR